MSARIKPSLAPLPKFRTLEVRLEAQRLAAADADISLVLPAESAAVAEVARGMQILVATDNGLEMKCFHYSRQ